MTIVLLFEKDIELLTYTIYSWAQVNSRQWDKR